MSLVTSLVAQSYGAARKISATAPGGADASPSGLSFSEALTEAARMMESTLREGESAATAAVQGSGDVQHLVEALSSTELALETAVTVRDRVVEAYQEILRMPV